MLLKGLLTKGEQRQFQGPLATGFRVAALALAAYHIYSAVFSYPEVILYRGIHVTAFTALALLLYSPPNVKDRKRVSLADCTRAATALTIGLYIVLDLERLVYRRAFVDPVLTFDIILGLILIILVLEATRRVLGWPLVLVALTFLLYPFAGPYIPGIFGNRGFGLDRVVETMFLTTVGMFGMPVGVVSTYVFMFILFGAFLNQSGAGDFFFNVARRVAGFTRGGIAKTAVVASALFGSISGSPISNVATTGSLTIPMMKKAGYSSHFAGAVETAASCGGTIMPPVMGAVAFVMAEVIGVPYREVILYAAVPALLYFISVFIAVDREAACLGLQGLAREDLPGLKLLLAGGVPHLVPLVLLVSRLLMGFSPTRVAFEAMLLIIFFAFLRRRLTLEKAAAAIEKAVKTTVSVSVACTAAGIVVGSISMTGVGAKFTSLILSLANGVLFWALVLTMAVTMVLGMGMSITPTYILAASLAAPALISAGVVPRAAHLFIVYFAAMATMTPPVAISAYTAATISGADPMKVGFTAVRLGIIAFIMPYIFVYRPEILLKGSAIADIAAAIAFVTLGVMALTTALDSGRSLPARVCYLALSLGCFVPQPAINAGAGLLYGVTLLLGATAPGRGQRPQQERKGPPS